MARLDSRQLAAAGVALVVAATAAWWGYGAYARWQAHKAAVALVNDTGARLREALRAEARGSPLPSPDGVAYRESELAAAERNHLRLKQIDAAALGAMADAADDYLVTGREALRRIAVGSRARVNLGASSEALRAHMSADRGRPGWPGEAVRLRERVDRDHREYRLAAETLVKLIDALPASQDKLAGVLDPSVRADAQLLASARAATLEHAMRIATEVERLTNLGSYR